MNRLFFFCSLPFLIFAGASSGGVPPIYNNGPPNSLDGYETTHWIQADDFTLGVAARLENVKLWSFEGSGSFQGSILWQIYSNSENDTPGTLLFSGTSTDLTHEATGFNLFGYDEFKTTFNIVPISLPAGVYWLALHNGPRSNNGEEGSLFWETTNNIGPRPSYSLISPFVDEWLPNALFPGSPAELAFLINGVPGPRITALAFNNNAPRVSFTTTAGQIYRLEYKNSLTDALWTTVLQAEAISGTGSVVAVSDPDPTVRNLARRFYRARLCPCLAIGEPSLTAFDFHDVPRISFTTTAGQMYRVEYKAELTNAFWTPLPGAESIPGTGQAIQIGDFEPNVRTLPRRFYRAILLL